jgi:hypothetical protein
VNLIEPLVRLRGGEAIQAGAMPPPLSNALEIEHLAAFPRLNPNPVLELSATGDINYFNDATGAMARELGLENPAQMLPPDIAAITRQCLADGTPKLRMKIQAGQRVISWSFFPVQLTNTVHGYGSDITEENRLHRDLIESSRMAGMAEVATSVLHNVGNVLNSVNVSSSLVSDKVRQSKIANLGKAVALLLEHEQDLAALLTHDAKGKQLPRYLHNLADHLAAEQAQIVKELALLTKNVDHIKEIVAMQQNYSRISGICEMVPPADLAEDAVRMNGASLGRPHRKRRLMCCSVFLGLVRGRISNSRRAAWSGCNVPCMQGTSRRIRRSWMCSPSSRNGIWRKGQNRNCSRACNPSRANGSITTSSLWTSI